MKKGFLMKKINSQSGQTGFLIILLMSALLIVAISVSVAVSQNSRRTMEETEGSRALNLAESGTDLIINNALEGLKDYNFTEAQINSAYTYQTDKGVVFPLPQGETLELNPSKNGECVNNSCVIGIWWHNNPDELACDQQAALLVSEYSQDAGDQNQTNCNNALGLTDASSQAERDGKINTYCGSDQSCRDYYNSCQSSANNEGTIDARTGLSRERARFYLFRPGNCAGATDTRRQWDGYETAFGNSEMKDSGENIVSACGRDNVACGPRSMTGVCTENSSDRACVDGSTKENCISEGSSSWTGIVQTCSNKQRQEYFFNPDLSKQFANYYEIPIFPNTTIVRIKALYADTEILVDLRDQVTQGISTVTDGSGTTRSIEVKKTVPSVPSVLDYALFSGGGDINKKAETDRD